MHLTPLEKILLFCSFASILILSLIPFIKNPDSSSDLTIFIMPSISSFEIINAVVPDPLISFELAHLLLTLLLIIQMVTKHF